MFSLYVVQGFRYPHTVFPERNLRRRGITAVSGTNNSRTCVTHGRSHVIWSTTTFCHDFRRTVLGFARRKRQNPSAGDESGACRRQKYLFEERRWRGNV